MTKRHANYIYSALLAALLLSMAGCEGKDDPLAIEEYIKADFNGNTWQAVNHQVVVEQDSVRLSIIGTSGSTKIKGVYLSIRKPLIVKSYPLDINTGNAAAYLTGDNNDLYMDFSSNTDDSLTFTFIDSVYAEGVFHFKTETHNNIEMNIANGSFHFHFDPLH